MGRKALTNHGSWVGREFKSFIQIAPLLCKQVSTPGDDGCIAITDLFIIISSLCKIIFHYPSHLELEAVADMIDRLVVDYLYISQELFSSGKDIFSKFKPHVIRHLAMHTILFGPLSKLATESQEKLNGDIRKWRHQVIVTSC